MTQTQTRIQTSRRPGRSLAIARLFTTLTLLAALLAALVPAAGHRAAAQDPPSADVTIDVHTCPDDVTATGFYQYASACDTEAQLYGVPLGLSVNGSVSSFQYTNPDNNAALHWRARTGAVRVAEVSSVRLREPVVFCSLSNEAPNSVNPPTMDGDEVPVSGGAMSIQLTQYDVLFCDWYRFPGGVAGEPDEDASADASSSDAPSDDDASDAPSNDASAAPSASDTATGEPSGTAVGVSVWTCEPSPGRDLFIDGDDPEASAVAEQYADPSQRGFDWLPFPLPYTGDPAADSLALMTACHQDDPYDFSLTGDDADAGDSRTIGGVGYTYWDGLPEGTYTVSEDDPEAVTDIRVYCQLVIAGTQNVRADIREVTVADSAISLDLADDQQYSCDWFNVRPIAETVDPADRGTSSIEISVFSCPEDADFQDAVDGGECLDPVDGVRFVADGPLDYTSQTDTGDARPGAVSFGGIDPGTWTITTPDGPDEAVAYCDGVEVPVEDGEARITVPARNDLQCLWYIPYGSGGDASDAPDVSDADGSDEPDASASPGSHNGDTQDPTNDSDDDGLLDSEEVPDQYGTDPNDPDTDGDGVVDGDEGLNNTLPLESDTDLDGLSDGEELYEYGTDPNSADSDGDGFDDGPEVDAGSDPNDFDVTPGS